MIGAQFLDKVQYLHNHIGTFCLFKFDCILRQLGILQFLMLLRKEIMQALLYIKHLLSSPLLYYDVVSDVAASMRYFKQLFLDGMRILKSLVY